MQDPTPSADYDAPNFFDLARETSYTRTEWERAWRESGGRDWQMIAALVEAGTHSPTGAVKALARYLPPAARLKMLTADFREWFAQTNPSDANRDQFNRWVTDLLAQAWDEGYASYGYPDNPYRVFPPGS